MVNAAHAAAPDVVGMVSTPAGIRVAKAFLALDQDERVYFARMSEFIAAIVRRTQQATE